MEKLRSLYCYYTYSYAYMTRNGEYATTYSELTESALFEHLDGKRTICVRGGKWETIFMTFDVDEADPAHMHALIDRIAELGIRREDIHVSISGRKGYHIDLFFDRQVPKWLPENFFDYVRRDPAIADIRMECRPINATTIKIPLGVNFKTGRRCWYVNRETLEPIKDFGYILGITPMPAAEFETLVRDINKRKKTEDLEIALRNLRTERAEKSESHDAGAWKQRVPDEPMITRPGERHGMTMRKAVWLRSIGACEDEIYKELWDWTERQNQSLISSGWREIDNDIRGIVRTVMRDVTPKVSLYKRTQGGSGKRISLTQEDIRAILPIKNKTQRKVAMLITLYCKVFGSCAMGLDRIADIVGVTHVTAQAAVNHLVEAGFIKKRKGGLQYLGDKPVLRPNKYMLCEDLPRDAGIEARTEISYTLPEVIEDFEHFYYATLAAMCDRRTLARYLSAAEMRNIGEE